jgi:hypothetical protein
MKSIDSEEKLGVPHAIVGEAPRHTVQGHEGCAYYMSVTEDPDLKAGIAIMRCPHGNIASGAFYSEDHVNEVRRVSHLLIGQLEEMIKLKKFKFMFSEDYMKLVENVQRLTDLTR